MAVRKRSTTKQKKIWYQILSSKEFRNLPIGETFSLEPNMLVGRVVKVNLAHLTNNMRNQSLEVEFEITDVKGTQANTKIKQYRLMPSNVKRIVRVGRSKIEDSFVLNTKDGVKVLVKPLLITTNLVQKNLASVLRASTKEYLEDLFKKTEFSSIINLLIPGRLQSNLRTNVKKIYPLAACQIRVLRRLK